MCNSLGQEKSGGSGVTLTSDQYLVCVNFFCSLSALQLTYRVGGELFLKKS